MSVLVFMMIISSLVLVDAQYTRIRNNQFNTTISNSRSIEGYMSVGVYECCYINGSETSCWKPVSRSDSRAAASVRLSSGSNASITLGNVIIAPVNGHTVPWPVTYPSNHKLWCSLDTYFNGAIEEKFRVVPVSSWPPEKMRRSAGACDLLEERRLPCDSKGCGFLYLNEREFYDKLKDECVELVKCGPGTVLDYSLNECVEADINYNPVDEVSTNGILTVDDYDRINCVYGKWEGYCSEESQDESGPTNIVNDQDDAKSSSSVNAVNGVIYAAIAVAFIIIVLFFVRRYRLKKKAKAKAKAKEALSEKDLLDKTGSPVNEKAYLSSGMMEPISRKLMKKRDFRIICIDMESIMTVNGMSWGKSACASTVSTVNVVSRKGKEPSLPANIVAVRNTSPWSGNMQHKKKELLAAALAKAEQALAPPVIPSEPAVATVPIRLASRKFADGAPGEPPSIFSNNSAPPDDMGACSSSQQHPQDVLPSYITLDQSGCTSSLSAVEIHRDQVQPTPTAPPLLSERRIRIGANGRVKVSNASLQ